MVSSAAGVGSNNQTTEPSFTNHVTLLSVERSVGKPTQPTQPTSEIGALRYRLLGIGEATSK